MYNAEEKSIAQYEDFFSGDLSILAASSANISKKYSFAQNDPPDT